MGWDGKKSLWALILRAPLCGANKLESNGNISALILGRFSSFSCNFSYQLQPCGDHIYPPPWMMMIIIMIKISNMVNHDCHNMI